MVDLAIFHIFFLKGWQFVTSRLCRDLVQTSSTGSGVIECVQIERRNIEQLSSTIRIKQSRGLPGGILIARLFSSLPRQHVHVRNVIPPRTSQS